MPIVSWKLNLIMVIVGILAYDALLYTFRIVST